MECASRLANSGIFLTSLNPRVGCIFTTHEGIVLSQGNTHRAGGSHAEIMALRAAVAQGHSVIDATLPASPWSTTRKAASAPVAMQLVAAGIKKVVASIADPNSLVS